MNVINLITSEAVWSRHLRPRDTSKRSGRNALDQAVCLIRSFELHARLIAQNAALDYTAIRPQIARFSLEFHLLIAQNGMASGPRGRPIFFQILELEKRRQIWKKNFHWPEGVAEINLLTVELAA